MATVKLHLSVEMDALHDAIGLLSEIHARLATKHGETFRKLDRAIERFIDDPTDATEIHWLGGGRLVAAPKGRLTEILREARELGVID
ncbi:hypothetical protein [uncultured Nitratireductor sp.]|uniref:hypothetical protein n=1 Tax=uncultured Nitratireductor sp. TaxID=520953 RepID=UPI0025F89F74|nr:hypothetical protein [uncultured Nitratireductor sp.]